MVMFFKQILFGNYFKDEYLCLDKSAFKDGLKVFLHSNSLESPIEITRTQLLLGYKPLLIGLPLKVDEKRLQLNQIISLKFIAQDSEQEIAKLFLKIIRVEFFEETSLFIAEGVQGKHYYLRKFHQTLNNLKERLTHKKEGNKIGRAHV